MSLSQKCLTKFSMEKITSIYELKIAISSLEKQQAEEMNLFKDQLMRLAESLKPSSIIKSTFLDLSKNQDIKNSVMNSSLSLATGYLYKKLIEGEHPSLLKQALGVLVQLGLSSSISNYSEKIWSGVNQLIHLFSSKKEASEEV
jgi:hypothetical protein